MYAMTGLKLPSSHLQNPAQGLGKPKPKRSSRGSHRMVLFTPSPTNRLKRKQSAADENGERTVRSGVYSEMITASNLQAKYGSQDNQNRLLTFKLATAELRVAEVFLHGRARAPPREIADVFRPLTKDASKTPAPAAAAVFGGIVFTLFIIRVVDAGEAYRAGVRPAGAVILSRFSCGEARGGTAGVGNAKMDDSISCCICVRGCTL